MKSDFSNSCAKHWRAQRGSFERQILKYKSDDLYIREGKAFLASHFGIYRLISPNEQCGYKDFVVSMITNLVLHLCSFCWFLIPNNSRRRLVVSCMKYELIFCLIWTCLFWVIYKPGTWYSAAFGLSIGMTGVLRDCVQSR